MDCRRTAEPRLGRLGSLGLAVALLISLGATAQSPPRALRLLQRTALPGGQSVATDIRWASANSVYISWDRDGVAEVGLDGSKRHLLVPDVKSLRAGPYPQYTHLAVSPRTLATASQIWTLVWRPLQPKAGGEVIFHKQEIAFTEDFDLFGDRLLLLGLAHHKRGEKAIAPDGAVAWMGTLSAKLNDLRPVLSDLGGPGAPNFYNCRTHPIGAVRFLADGSSAIVPGFQDGAHLFDAEGRRIRTWTNAQVGLDTHVDCAKIQNEQQEFIGDAGWMHFLNSHHVVDDILPLPQGPGLLVRFQGADGKARWTLKVLRPEGITVYQVPVVGSRPMDRLRGDVRDGRIVLLLSASGFDWSRDPAHFPAEILLMEAPDA